MINPFILSGWMTGYTEVGGHSDLSFRFADEPDRVSTPRSLLLRMEGDARNHSCHNP